MDNKGSRQILSLIENIQLHSKGMSISSDKKESLKSFFKTGFPTTKNEEWKYTSLKRIVSKNYSVDCVGKNVTDEEIHKNSLGFSKKIIFSDGVLISTPSINNVTVSSYSEFKNNNVDSISQLNYALAT